MNQYTIMTLAYYQKRFKEGYEKRMRLKKEYIEKNGINILYDSINSFEHPDYFKIDTEWDELRAELDKPLLKDAYYKVGDKLTFVKRNTYNSNEGRPHLYRDKAMKSYVLFDKDYQDDEYHDWADDDKYVSSPPRLSVYYENVISTGVVWNIKTSDAGSGQILYGFDELNPPCPESNPYVLEQNVITAR